MENYLKNEILSENFFVNVSNNANVAFVLRAH
jgi:hypothetical protein